MDIDEFRQRKVKRGYVWLKLFTDLIDEPEFMQLTDKAKAVYFEVYILAGRSDAGGLITSGDKPAKVDQLAWLLRRTTNELQGGLDELQSAGLVDLQGGQVTVCRFGNEQGPSQDEKRAQWREWQRESRARAKGEKLPDKPSADADTDESDADVDESDKQDSKTNEQDLKTDEQDLNTQTKRVSQTSGESQGGVRTDTISGGGLIDSGLVLSVWHDMTGLEFKRGDKFDAMIKDWQSAGVTVQNVRDAITQANGEANTPLYLAISAKNLHKKETASGKPGTMTLETARQLYRQNKDQAGGGLDEILAGAPIFAEDKQTGGDSGVHE